MDVCKKVDYIYKIRYKSFQQEADKNKKISAKMTQV
jgi:hypothetical protein